VRNTALKMHENARRELALEDDTLNAICEREQTVPNPASCIPDSMTLRTMLDQLEPKRRASLLLTIIDGRTHEEIAKYLRVPVGTVKAWIRMRTRGHAPAARMRRKFIFRPLHPSACVGDSKGDGVVIRTRHVPATVANPKRGAKPCLS